MIAKPQAEHQWLHKLVGDWTMKMEATCGPDEPPTKLTGKELVRSLGGLWTIGEGEGEMPGGGKSSSIMTLGYDPSQQRFVGTFVAGVMTFLWKYSGTLDATQRILTLDTEGPSFAGDGTMVNYKDIIEFIDDDHRTLTSQSQNADGSWTQFMTAHYHRVK